MEVSVEDITEPVHNVGGGGNGKGKEIEAFILAELEAGKTNIADSEIASAVGMELTTKTYINIKNHTNLMRIRGLFAWTGTVNKGEHKGEHLYNAGLDEKYYNKKGYAIPDADGEYRKGQINIKE